MKLHSENEILPVINNFLGIANLIDNAFKCPKRISLCALYVNKFNYKKNIL